MKRFRWSFQKTLEFMDSKNSNLQIKGLYFSALKKTALEYCRNNKMSSSWYNDFLSGKEYREEDIVLTNTFLNSRKMRAETEFACMISRQLKNRSYEKRVRKSVQWADRIRRSKVKAKSALKNGKSVNSMKGKTIKPVKSLKIKCRANNVKTELDDSYDDNCDQKSGDKKNFQLSSNSEFYQKSLRQFQRKILANSNQEKSGKNTDNNSYSKSTNVQEDLSNIEKQESNENKTGVFKILKDGSTGIKRPKQFKDSFLKNLKFLKVVKADNQEPETETNKTSNRMNNQGKSSRIENTNNSGLNRHLDDLSKDQKFKSRALKFDNERLSHKNESGVNPKSLISLSKLDNPQFDSKTDNNYMKTQIIMKKLLEQKNPSFNTSIEPDKQKPLLKSNKNSELFNNKDDKNKRPSSAPGKGKFIRRAQGEENTAANFPGYEEQTVAELV